MTTTSQRYDKWVCEECGEVCSSEEILMAVNPFNEEQMILGCPHCREVSSLVACCEADGCSNPIYFDPATDELSTKCKKHQ
jgi:hypothetical protein